MGFVEFLIGIILFPIFYFIDRRKNKDLVSSNKNVDTSPDPNWFSSQAPHFEYQEPEEVEDIEQEGDEDVGVTDLFGIGKIKARNRELEKELAELKAIVTPEQQAALNLTEQITRLNGKIAQKQSEINNLQKEIDKRKEYVFDLDDAMIFQDFSLYKPRYNFVKSEMYLQRLGKIRDEQKELIKSGRAVIGNNNWTVNYNAKAGRQMVRDTQKLLLRAFNCECDDAIGRVTYANIELSEKRIRHSAESISKLGKIMSLSITDEYLNSKISELYLAFEYEMAKQKEKEEQKELRAQMREEAKLQKEIEEARKKVTKEQVHYKNALEKLEKQILKAKTDEEKTDLEAKKSDILSQLDVIETNLKDIDYREANIKAGYVYIISNIGAFGENVYKIGMTRRLDPQERIDELGDASVPFKFDVHAMIFSDNAPALEAALHKTFENKKINMINQRKEFFNVTLDEIKDAVKKNFDKTVEFVDIASAEQFRTSKKMKELRDSGSSV